jgi:hypothetical protein
VNPPWTLPSPPCSFFSFVSTVRFNRSPLTHDALQQSKHLILSSAVSGGPPVLRCATAMAQLIIGARAPTLLAPFPTERQEGVLRQWSLPKSERLAGGTIWPRRTGRLVSPCPRHLTGLVTRPIYASSDACSLLLNALGLTLCKPHITVISSRGIRRRWISF